MTLPLTSLWLIIGILPLLWLAALPPWWSAGIFITLAMSLCAVNLRKLRYLATGLLGFAWALLSAHQAIWPLTHFNTQPQWLELRIQQTDGATRHLAQITHLPGHSLSSSIPLTLTSRRLPVPVCAGQGWNMQVKLRTEHGTLNEGGFDSQRHALTQHRVLTGRVLNAQPLDTRCSLRANYITLLQQALADRRWRSVIMALAVGERADLSDDTKNLLRNTATAHLMAISGLHIGFAALLGIWLARLLQWLLPARHIGYRLPLFTGLLVALLYTWISGANPPAQRSLVALSMWMLIRLTGRQWYAWQVWLCCLAAVLFIDPLSVLSDSFWLSAFAVAALIFWYQWLPFPASHLPVWWRYPLSLLHLQCGIMLLLLPLQVLIFHGISLTSIIANLLAVPLVAVFTLPLILAAMIILLLPWPWLAQPLWWLADHNLQWVFSLLTTLPDGWVTVDARYQWLTLLPWLALILWQLRFQLISPAAALVLLVLLLFPLWRKSPPGAWALHVLDIGSGQAIVIERHGNALIYDTGTAWPGGDSAQQTIIPWLRWHHLTPQAVIISHTDFDKHAGLRTLRNTWRQLMVIGTQPQSDNPFCQQGQQWHWQGLHFQAYWPARTTSVAERTCVIKITDTRHHSVLLTGNLNASAERDMLRYHWRELQAQTLLVPRRASNQASSDLLLSRVNGQLALASIARYGIRQSALNNVKQRYQQQNYIWYDTAHTGQITLRFTGTYTQLQTFRQHITPRWYHRWFSLRDEPALTNENSLTTVEHFH